MKSRWRLTWHSYRSGNNYHYSTGQLMQLTPVLSCSNTFGTNKESIKRIPSAYKQSPDLGHEKRCFKTKFKAFYRVATVNWMWKSRTFPGLFEQIQGPFAPNKIYYMLKNFLFLYTNSAMSFTRLASGEKFSLPFRFQTLLYWRYNVRLWQFWLFYAVKGENFCPF